MGDITIDVRKIGISVLVVSTLAFLFLSHGFGWLGGADGSRVTGAAVASSGFRIPLSEVAEDAKWYEYDSNDVTIKFFAIRDVNGDIKTAFDACDICYSSHKGYRQEGGYMICNNCGNRYPISGLGTENKRPGGCWPGYLKSRANGEYLVIDKSDLESGRYRFA